MKTILTFYINGSFHCDGLNSSRPIRIGGGLLPGEVGCESCGRFAKCGMSHVSLIATEVTDLAAVEALCAEKGWQFKRGQRTYRWYGRFVGDSPLPEGMKVEDLGKCTHAISVPGCGYDIGLVHNPKTGGYKLAYDFWGTGQKLKAEIGEGGGRFLQLYGVAKATLIARKNGYVINKTTMPNGTIRLQVSGM